MIDRTVIFDFTAFYEHQPTVFCVYNNNDTEDLIYGDLNQSDTAKEAMGHLQQYYEAEEGVVDFSDHTFVIKYRPAMVVATTMTAEFTWGDISILAGLKDAVEYIQELLPGGNPLMKEVRETVYRLVDFYKTKGAKTDEHP